MSKELSPLKRARKQLGLSLMDAASYVGCSWETIRLYEKGYRPKRHGSFHVNVRNLCRAYMQSALELGYDPWEFHESALVPDEFPKPLNTGDLNAIGIKVGKA